MEARGCRAGKHDGCASLSETAGTSPAVTKTAVRRAMMTDPAAA
jgi:hypothetical protein